MHLKLSYGREELLNQFSADQPVTVSQVLQTVEGSHPEIYKYLCDKEGRLRNSLSVFVNGEHIRYLNGLETVLTEGDEIYIIPLITGG